MEKLFKSIIKIKMPSRLFLTYYIFFLLFGGIVPEATAALTDGLLVYYSFENSFDDFSGNGLHGSGDALFGSGPIGRAVYFDGFDRITAPSSSIKPLNQISISLWAKYDVEPTDWSDNKLLSNSNWPYQTGFWLDVMPKRSDVAIQDWFHPRFVVATSNTPEPVHTLNSVIADTAIEIGTWHHIAGIYDGINRKIFIDGVLATGSTSPAANGTIVYGNSFLFDIGAWRHLSGSDFVGGIDEVRIYDRALTSSEIATLASPVPIPGAIWLFASGFACLVGLKRRKTKFKQVL